MQIVLQFWFQLHHLLPNLSSLSLSHTHTHQPTAGVILNASIFRRRAPPPTSSSHNISSQTEERGGGGEWIRDWLDPLLSPPCSAGGSFLDPSSTKVVNPSFPNYTNLSAVCCVRAHRLSPSLPPCLTLTKSQLFFFRSLASSD